MPVTSNVRLGFLTLTSLALHLNLRWHHVKRFVTAGVITPDGKSGLGLLFNKERVPELKAAIEAHEVNRDISLAGLSGELGLTWPQARRLMEEGVLTPDGSNNGNCIRKYFFKRTRLPEIKAAIKAHEEASRKKNGVRPPVDSEVT